jgi:EAL domain-containing protein (putative c-di-GMP-specific phosphodiesterase class I)
MVKIDGSFIQNLGTQADDEMFVRTLIDLASNFGRDGTAAGKRRPEFPSTASAGSRPSGTAPLIP